MRRLVGGVLSGTPNYEEMSPELAAAVRQQLPQTQTVLARLGPVVSVEFLGVGNQGWDAYQLKHEHGVSQVKIMLNSKGIITGALQTFGP